MPPVRAGLLYQADGAGRAGAKIDRKVHADAYHVIVCPGESRVEETLRIEYGQPRGGKHVLYCLQAGLGGTRPIGMPAHAIEYQHQRRFFRYDHGSPILIVLTVSYSGDFCVFDPHVAQRSSVVFRFRRSTSVSTSVGQRS
jgi:hypothetical protein